ncbi:MAG: hypothetical protein U0132_20665 [Gemmatimonadaceae bacterium]
MLPTRIVAVGLATFLAATGLALTRGHPRGSHELDGYSDERLRHDFEAEFHEIAFPPDAQESLSDLKTAILDALADADDDDSESDIDFQDVEDEMEEAGTTVDAVVDEALAAADELAARSPAHGWQYAVGEPAPMPAQQPLFIPAMQSRNIRRGFTTTRVALRQTTNLLVVNIRKAR